MQKRNKIKQLINTIEIARRNNQPHVTIDTQIALEAVHELNSRYEIDEATMQIESEVSDGGQF